MKLCDKEYILSVIATPIGNLEEVSERVIKCLNEVYVILCEDTRVTAKLLHLLNIYDYKKLISYHNFNEIQKLNEAINYIKKYPTALVSDAGYPTISDPGYKLINECHQQNIGIQVINGPSSLMHALVASGMCSQDFMFLGFLGKTQKQRVEKLKLYKNLQTTFVIYEAVHRIEKTLMDIYEIWGDILIFIGRELTKKNESHYYGYLSQLPPITEKGEFVIVIDNKINQDVIKNNNINECLIKIRDLMKQNFKLKDACKEVSKSSNFDSKELYKLIINQK